jgi:hypothetical protein
MAKKKNESVAADKLKQIEEQQVVVDAKKKIWQDEKEAVAQARKEYEVEVETLGSLIRGGPSTPLLDTGDENED